MKKTSKIIGFIIVMSLFVSIFMPTAYAATNDTNSENTIKLIAHRGYSGSAPENTLAAFRLAGENGFYGCEFDIHETLDGQWVIMHDEKVDAMTNGKGNISEMTYAEIAELKIDSGNNIKKYPNEKVPTLHQALDVCSEYGINPIIEIKTGNKNDFGNLANILTNYTDFDKITVVSFSKDYLKDIRQLLPTTKIWLLVSKVEDSDIEWCVENNMDGIFYRVADNNSQTVAAIKNANLVTSAWVVDSLSKANNLESYGVEYLATNSITPKDKNSKNVFERIIDFLKSIVEWFNTLFK